jgi:hypothetical protein
MVRRTALLTTEVARSLPILFSSGLQGFRNSRGGDCHLYLRDGTVLQAHALGSVDKIFDRLWSI